MELNKAKYSLPVLSGRKKGILTKSDYEFLGSDVEPVKISSVANAFVNEAAYLIVNDGQELIVRQLKSKATHGYSYYKWTSSIIDSKFDREQNAVSISK